MNASNAKCFSHGEFSIASWVGFFVKENKFEDEALCTVWLFECSIQCVDAELFRHTWMKYWVFQRGAWPMKYLVMWRLEDAMAECFRDCVCVCFEGWLYTWLKGNIVESLLFLRDSFLYTKQPRDKQVLNR